MARLHVVTCQARKIEQRKKKKENIKTVFNLQQVLTEVKITILFPDFSVVFLSVTFFGMPRAEPLSQA